MVPDGSVAAGGGAGGNRRDSEDGPNASHSRGSASPDGQQPADRQRTRCCRGLTYFSQAMLDNGKLPACVGIPTTPGTPPDLSSIPPETVPAGDFKYLCLGYSVYEEAQLRDSWRGVTGPGVPLQVPYCEGVEIVSAADTTPAAAPVLLKEGLDPGSPPPTPVGQQPPPERPRQPRPRFATPPQLPGSGGGGGGVDWATFPEKFTKTAGLIVNRMGANVNHMATSVKKAWEKAKDEASGGGKRDN